MICLLIALMCPGCTQDNPPTPKPILQTPTRQISNPFDGHQIYDDPNDQASLLARQWLKSRPSDALALSKVGSQPWSRWFAETNWAIAQEIGEYFREAEEAKSLPVSVLYMIPKRDCSSLDAGGGFTSTAQYREWIARIGVAAIFYTGPAVFILEPDAVASWDCLSKTQRDARIDVLQYAINTLATKNHAVYLDVGNPAWHTPDEILARIKSFDLTALRGFALNVSNFIPTTEVVAYAEALYAATSLPSVIDTSRNGNGHSAQEGWCNPPGRALGDPPRAITNNPAVDAYLWVKAPGESDGRRGDAETDCHGGPDAGEFWPAYAVELGRNAHW